MQVMLSDRRRAKEQALRGYGGSVELSGNVELSENLRDAGDE
jgi:hypothetical protein